MFENFNKDQNKTAIILDNGEKISYKKIIKDSDSIIKSLEKKKSLVFIFCENNYETVISYVACLRSNHVPYLIDSLFHFIIGRINLSYF